MLNHGLSPRVRGNHIPAAPGAFTFGSIPACAGEPFTGNEGVSITEVYPRVCGGTATASAAGLAATGLSPRVRGNPPGVLETLADMRSIPACAGEPIALPHSPGTIPVYPRVCGGTRFHCDGSLPASGLSPRVRGNLEHKVGSISDDGSIPACAGEPSMACSRSRSARVYPRVCGGTAVRPATSTRYKGLSPRVRGNLLAIQRERQRQRSIPACAGEPSTWGFPNSRQRVYPRVCGGTAWSFPAISTVSGLSPRVRGNRRRGGPVAIAIGSIPACAGEPTPRSGWANTGRVYPRVCGGTSRSWSRPHWKQGLSPRVRGNPLGGHHRQAVLRSIPACAGEPMNNGQQPNQYPVYPRVCGGTASSPWTRPAGAGLSPRVRGNLEVLGSR